MRQLGLGLIFLILCACASQKKNEALMMTMVPGSPAAAQLENAALPASGEKDLNDNETDMQNLPVEMNEKVTIWIEYFQGRGRKHMNRYLSRSSRYLPKMKQILKSHGLPEDLVYIALIESGFNSKALSRANAVGYWQFIRGTGRRYGLKQGYYVDERRDFIASTEAAAKYLKALYNLFGSWYLAIASYNVGENRIKNVVMRYYTRDFWLLAQQKRLPRETTNYVPKFLAARLIAKHPEKYGFENIDYEQPLNFKEIEVVNQGVDLKKFAKHLNIKKDIIYGLNPAYKRGIVPKVKGKVALRVPVGLESALIAQALAKSYSKITSDLIAVGEGRSYRIRRGDTLSHIAGRFGTTVRSLREANNLSRRSTLYPGKRIIVPYGRKRRRQATTSIKLNQGEKKYRVRQGDSLYSIAKKFNVSLSLIKKRNGLGRRTLLNIGKTLVIPVESKKNRVVNMIADKIIHVVQKGETLYEIAQRYNTTISALTKANKMSRRASLSIGKKLVIP